MMYIPGLLSLIFIQFICEKKVSLVFHDFFNSYIALRIVLTYILGNFLISHTQMLFLSFQFVWSHV